MGMLSPDENGWIPEEEAAALRKVADVARAMRDMDKNHGLTGVARKAEASRLLGELFRAVDDLEAYDLKGKWKALVAGKPLGGA